MTVNLSIKDVPDATAKRLRARAARNHRSLQGELLAIVEFAVAELPRRSKRPEVADDHTVHTAEPLARQPDADEDSLLDELDLIVQGSQWGQAPLLSREQANDRRLQRELEYEWQRQNQG